MNFTRNGKIARLPRAVRTELNQRLAEGEMGESLLPWLNGLPEVREVLAERFGGQPISDQNLSAWRQGGFTEWERAEGVREWSERLVEQCDELEETSGAAPLAERMALPVLMELMQLLQVSSASEDLGERRRTVLGVARQLTQLCRTGHQTARLEIERARWSYEERQLETVELEQFFERKKQVEHMETVRDMLFSTFGAHSRKAHSRSFKPNQGDEKKNDGDDGEEDTPPQNQHLNKKAPPKGPAQEKNDKRPVNHQEKRAQEQGGTSPGEATSFQSPISDEISAPEVSTPVSRPPDASGEATASETAPLA